MNELPIGVFDSGVGGLTVAREVLRQLPEESVLYLGDTARVPYGPRGQETIRRFARELAGFLLDRGVKALVIACNSISAIAGEDIRRMSPVPVIDVIDPTVRAAVAATRTGRLGVIGTVTTVRSGIYRELARGIRGDVEVSGRECPLFVPIAEENLQDHPVAELMAREYLRAFEAERPDVLILGCTHYPLLKDVVGKVMGPEVRLIDSAEPTVRVLAEELDRRGLRRRGEPRHRFYVTDASYKFIEIASAIMTQDVSPHVEQIALEEVAVERC
ncbi:MAG: glutamate racemase [Armatimonadota bacterium]